MRPLIRALPALSVTLLLAAALLAPGRGVSAGKPGAGIDALVYPVCMPIQLTDDPGEPWTLTLDPEQGVVQPLGALGNMSACSLTVQSTSYINKRTDLVYWNPQTLAPDPSTVAIRSRTYSATYTTFNAAKFDFYPPIITRVLPGVAEVPPAETAFEYRVFAGSHSSETASFDPDGPSGIPAALGIRGNQHPPIGGPHPVLRHSVCGGDGALQTHYVAQSVIRTETTLPPINAQFIQKFRVPAPVSLRWVEFVLKPHPPVGGHDYGQVIVADAEGQASPPVNFDAPLASANFVAYALPAPTWYSHFDFAGVPDLEPDHDYWLAVTTYSDYELGARVRTSAESPYFNRGVGPLFIRPAMGAGPYYEPALALDFKIIGVPLANVGVGGEIRKLPGFELSVAPNPARGPAFISWRGARGDLRFEVLDARGRRVSSGGAGLGESGQWSWSGTGEDGRALPAGVYFVRARDGVGRTASVRVTRVR